MGEMVENSTMGLKLNRMISEATDQLIEMNNKDKEKLTGQEWLDNLKRNKEKILKQYESSDEIKSEIDEKIAGEKVSTKRKRKNRLAEAMPASEVVAEEKEEKPVAIAPKKKVVEEPEPTEQPKKVEVKPQVPDKKIRLTSVEDERSKTSLPESRFETETDKEEHPRSYAHRARGLTDEQQNIKTVFSQIMESSTATSQPDIASYIEYCIQQTRNTFGLKTVIQDIEIKRQHPDYIVVKSQDVMDYIELAKYYLEYLLEDEEFLRYLEPEELLLPKVLVKNSSNRYLLKNTAIVENSLTVFGMFARDREFEPVSRLVKISTDIGNGIRISRALEKSQGDITITLDSKTEFPSFIKGSLEKSKLSYLKMTGNDLQEQRVGVEYLKFEEGRGDVGREAIPLETRTEEVSEEGVLPESVEIPEKQLPAHLQALLEEENQDTEVLEDSKKSEEEKEVEVVATPTAEEPISATEQEEGSTDGVEVADTDVEESSALTEDDIRDLLVFFSTAIIDSDYKNYLRKSREDQEKDLIVDLQGFLRDFEEDHVDASLEQVLKYSYRLKEVFNPLAEIAKANGYTIEELRDIEYMIDFNIESDDFPENTNSTYLYLILLTIKEYWIQAEKAVEEEEQQKQLAIEEEEKRKSEEEERERVARIEAEREEAERFEEERKAKELEEAERLANEEVPEITESDSEGSKEVVELSDETENDDDFEKLLAEEQVDDDFNLGEELAREESKSKSKKRRKKREKKSKDLDAPILGEITETDDEKEKQFSKKKKKIAIVSGVGLVAFAGLSAGGLYMVNNHIQNGKAENQAQEAKAVQNKVNVLSGALHSSSDLSFIDSHNSLKLSKNPYDNLLLAKAKDLTPEQLANLEINKKVVLTISDSGKQQKISLAGIVTDVKDVGVPELKGVNYLKWVDTNNVPYFMPYKG